MRVSSDVALRRMVGNYTLNKAHLKVDNFGRVFYGEYMENVHGVEEPYYLPIGIIRPACIDGPLTLIRARDVSTKAWSVVEPFISDLLKTRTTA